MMSAKEAGVFPLSYSPHTHTHRVSGTQKGLSVLPLPNIPTRYTLALQDEGSVCDSKQSDPDIVCGKRKNHTKGRNLDP